MAIDKSLETVLSGQVDVLVLELVVVSVGLFRIMRRCVLRVLVIEVREMGLRIPRIRVLRLWVLLLWVLGVWVPGLRRRRFWHVLADVIKRSGHTKGLLVGEQLWYFLLIWQVLKVVIVDVGKLFDLRLAVRWLLMGLVWVRCGIHRLNLDGVRAFEPVFITEVFDGFEILMEPGLVEWFRSCGVLGPLSCVKVEA